MANVFAAPDIATILAAFQPQRPTAQIPSLVWSHNGEKLRDSSKVQSKFDKLLAESNERLAAATLAPRLDVKNHDWCLASQTRPLIYSADKRYLLAGAEANSLLEDLRRRADEEFLDLTAAAAEKDADLDSLKSALERTFAGEIEIVYSSQGKVYTTWISSKALNQKTEGEIETLLKQANVDTKIDLSANLKNVPQPFIQTMAEKVSEQKSLPGTVRQGKTRITFMSAEYEARVKEEQAKKIAREFSKILVNTHRHGYHKVPEETKEAQGLRKVFFERTKAGLDDGSFSLIHSNDLPIALAFSNRLETLVNDLKSKAEELVTETWNKAGATSTVTSLDDDKIETLIDTSSSQEFARLVLEDVKYRQAIEESMKSKLEQLENNDQQRSNDAFNEYVRVPTTLYLTGLHAVQDPGLRRRLEDFVFEFLRKDLIPTGIQHAEEEKHLRNKPIDKDIERFHQTCDDAKSVAELQNALNKFARKQKLENVTQADEDDIKARILQQKAKSMKKMTRASDILQNLIWILLAGEHDGLFISSGRDTTRMIKFYQAVGNELYGQKIEAWKDKFKAGQETGEDYQDMRVMADEVLAKKKELSVRFDGEA